MGKKMEDTSFKVRNENKDLTTYPTDTKSITKKYYVNKDGMDKFLERQNLQKLIQEESL